MATNLGSRYCSCNSLTVSALCLQEGFPLAPDLATLKESAEQSDPCQFCLISWTAIKRTYPWHHERWAQEALEVRHTDKAKLTSYSGWEFSITARASFSLPLTSDAADGGRLEHKEQNQVDSKRQTPKITIRAVWSAVKAPTLGVFALPETAAATFIQARCSNIDVDPHQKATLELIANWMSECESHQICKSIRQKDASMPTRVMDVSNGQNARLVLSSGNPGKYMALSYCWGPPGKDIFVLTKDTKSALLQGLDDSKFVRSHREAFQIARALGIQYVWIDALCIIQGDRQDWEAESRKMGDVYGNASLTLVAGSSADSRTGFLRDRCSLIPPVAMTLDGADDGALLFANLPRSHAEGPTLTRGWCFQEAKLCKRAVIFGTEQIAFRCPTGSQFEQDEQEAPASIPTNAGKDVPVFQPTLQLQGLDEETKRNVVLEHWYIMLREFTSRHLSNPNDIFASLNSLAKAVGQYLGSRYLAGIWETDLVRGLLWRPSFYGAEPSVLIRPQPTLLAPGPVNRAPSWSWAAVQGSIDHLDYEPGVGEPGPTLPGPFPENPSGDRIQTSVFATKPGFVKVRPAIQLKEKQDSTTHGWSWSADTHCGIDVLHMPACEIRLRGCITSAVMKDEKVDIDEWHPRSDWRPDDQRPSGVDTFYNGSKYVFERGLGIYSYGLYLFDGKEQDEGFAIGLFDVQDEVCSEVWCLQLTEIEGLILQEVAQKNGVRTFQRMGIFWLEEKGWFDGLSETELCLV